jgi:AcrR family transcriptional regulator
VKKQTVEERRNEILETTCSVVIERGFAGTRIADVAKRLNVSTSLIHYHYDSKEQLLAEAFSHYARKDLAELDAEIETAPNSVAQLDRAIQNYVPEGSDDVEWMLWIDAWGEALRNPMMKKISQELDQQSAQLLERVLNGGVQSGEFRCVDPAASALRLTGLIDGLAIQFAAHDGLLTRDAFINHVRTLAAAEVGVSIAEFNESASAPAAVSNVLSPLTDLALRQLVNRFCLAVQDANSTDIASLWAPDGVWVSDGGDELVGRNGIAAAWVERLGDYAWIVSMPVLAEFNVDESLNGATGRVVISERFARNDGSTGSILGRYTDRYSRLAGGWVFAERRFELIESC